MINIIVQLSKYIMIALMAAYTFSCFSIFAGNYEDEERRVLIRQDVLIFMMQFIAFAVMYLTTDDMRILFIYAALMIVLLGVILLYSLIYPNVSKLVVNNMCMLITVGMIMITRLSADNKTPYGSSIRQLVFVVLGVAFGLVVPILIRKLTFLTNGHGSMQGSEERSSRSRAFCSKIRRCTARIQNSGISIYSLRNS